MLCEDEYKHYIDLNGDSVQEWVMRQEGCAYGEYCAYEVFGETPKNEVLSLGTLFANYVTLGHNYHNGVRNLHAYDKHHNDFTYSVYIWNEQTTRYEKTGPARRFEQP